MASPAGPEREAFPGVRLHVVRAEGGGAGAGRLALERPPSGRTASGRAAQPGSGNGSGEEQAPAEAAAAGAGDPASVVRSRTADDLLGKKDRLGLLPAPGAADGPAGGDGPQGAERRAKEEQRREKKDKQSAEATKRRSSGHGHHQRPHRQASLAALKPLADELPGSGGGPFSDRTPAPSSAARNEGAALLIPAPGAAGSRRSLAAPGPGRSSSAGSVAAPGAGGRFYGRALDDLAPPARGGAPRSAFASHAKLSAVPLIVFALLEHIARRGLGAHPKEGLFRISGRAEQLSELRQQLDALPPEADVVEAASAVLERYEVHAACGAAKLLFREQPEPLVPSAMRCLVDRGALDDRLLQARTLLSLMPSRMRHTLLYLLGLLCAVRAERATRMSATALGVVFGPVLMRVNESDLAQLHVASAVVEALVHHADALALPAPLLSPRSPAASPPGSLIAHAPRSLTAASAPAPVTASPTAPSPASAWAPEKVAAWLCALAPGLAQYSAAFEAHAVDGGALLELDREDLGALGVRLVGHQKTILRAARALR